MSENIKTKTFELVEETNIKKTGKETFWYTRSNKDGYPCIVNDSLAYNKEEAEKMFHLIVENNGVMKSEKVLKTIEVVAK
tara:strand:- start:108 stop:347 length:240 start_codon:yes stop_codon:yes gene_type:complete